MENEKPWFLNHYHHMDCPVEPGVEWDDEWDCMCNDHCPACDAEIAPYDSEDLTVGESEEDLPI